MSQSTNNTAYNAVPADYTSEVGRIQFLIRTALAGLRTAMPVKVIDVTNAGGVSPIGTLTVQPLVNLIDGNNVAWIHQPVYNVPYMRIQGGANAVIIDPQVGDIGIATVCDRDISTVKSAKAPSAPGSNRKNDMSDMVYLMTIIGAAPTQYIQFNSSGLNIVSPTKVTITAPEIDSTGVWNHSGNMNVTGNLGVTGTGNFGGNVTGNGVGLNTHHHSGVQTGSGNTGGPAG